MDNNNGQIVFGSNVGNDVNVNNNGVTTPEVQNNTVSVPQQVQTSIVNNPSDVNQNVVSNNESVIPIDAGNIIPGGVTPVNNDNPTPVSAPVVENTVSADEPLGFDLPSANSNVSPADNNTNLNTSVSLTNEVVASTSNTETTIPVNPDTNNDSVSQSSYSNSSSDVSVGTYLGHMFLFSIPFVGFILLIVKAFDKKNKNISNWAKSMLLYSLILTVITVVISILLIVVAGVKVTDVLNNGGNNSSDYTYDYYE